MKHIVAAAALLFVFGAQAWGDENGQQADPACNIQGDLSATDRSEAEHHTIAVKLAQGDWKGIRVEIWSGASPELLQGTPFYAQARAEGLNVALLAAAARGDDVALSRLIAAGADVNVVGAMDDEMTPLIWASRCDHLSTVELLVDHGADATLGAPYPVPPKSLVEDSTALAWAAQSGDAAIVTLLLRHGAKVNKLDIAVPDIVGSPLKQVKGHTPLYYSTSLEATKALLEAGADPNLVGFDGISRLMGAAADGHLDECKALLAHGADPKLRDRNGDAAIDYAKDWGHDAVASYLASL